MSASAARTTADGSGTGLKGEEGAGFSAAATLGELAAAARGAEGVIVGCQRDWSA